MASSEIRIVPSWPLTHEQSLRLDSKGMREILPQLIDSLSDAVLVVDRSFRVVAANRRYLEAFGAERADLVGNVCRHSLNCPAVGASDAADPCDGCLVIEQKRARQFIRSLPAADGAPHRWEATLNPVLDVHGEVSHVVEVWRDISDRSRLEMQLSHSERLASLGMLAAGVAHEINNPVASVLAGVESLNRLLARARGMPPGAVDEAHQVLSVLERAAERCRETTEKLLLLAQPARVAPSHVDVNRAVRDTLSLLGYQMRKQGVRVLEELDPSLPPIWAREGGVRGICMNLAMNGVQAMTAGGTLTVRTRRHRDGVSLEIEDTGPGIAPEHFDRIWDPFFTTKPTGQGTGLGLSITRGVVTRHGGSIRAENRPGGGARFVVQLPLAGPGGDGA